MAKVRDKKAAERRDVNRRIDRQGGAIQELTDMKGKGKGKNKRK